MPIRRPNRNYDSDYMSREMDDRLEEIEERITALYANAENEARAELDDFLSQFAEEDNRMRARLEEGEITDEAYSRWRRREILRSTQYALTINSLSQILTNTDVAAMALLSGELPYVIAESYNFVTSLGWAAADAAGLSVGTFQIYNANAVQALIRDNPSLLPSVNLAEDSLWNKNRINREIMQSILHGDSIPEIADRLQRVTTMDENAAIRNARTAMTYAENMGRDESYQRLKAMGIPVRKKWSAVMDARTRPTHRLMNGTYANEDDLFGEGIISPPLLRCPGDKRGAPEEIYNCRCREGVVFDEGLVDHSNDDKLYENFMQQNYPDDYEALKNRDYFNEHRSLPAINELTPADNLSSDHRGIVQGEDITETWQRRPDEFKYTIDDVLDAQGFNGLPRIVNEEEFNRAVEESGFIAQRTYSAGSQAEIDEFRNQLYNGNWYVNCETGGAQYGQGMYCAADYTGHLTEGIQAEMKHYQELGMDRNQTNASMNFERNITYQEVLDNTGMDFTEQEYNLLRTQRTTIGDSSEWYRSLTEDEKNIIASSFENGKYNAFNNYYASASDKFMDEYFRNGGIHYTETLTLTPDAKIISFDEINRMYNGTITREDELRLATEFFESKIDFDSYNEYENIILRDMTGYKVNDIPFEKFDEAYKNTTPERISELQEMARNVKRDAEMHVSQIVQEGRDRGFTNQLTYGDVGAYAAALGYDAINAEFHGASESYTVILNRTKVIFKRDET